MELFPVFSSDQISVVDQQKDSVY
ncbi:hypothetical protein PPL_02540 [Heterostelium album PN500]|uniref:Uncharacterized protein n=1 Tax=Heterostelium pallidum (strain ATCC 26659 / Pp 5 / PN500) TaxID=670386 RepID=D3B2D0_HETP5|nr:hypothetical protein PPL_02540 [Heterostelium album PN500]